MDQNGVTRRVVLEASTLVAASLPFAGSALGAGAPAGASAGETVATMPVSLTINGSVRRFEVDPRTSVLDLLREHAGLTGTKKGCDHGQCGACTVMIGGRRVNSCLTLAVMHDGEEVMSIEGLAHGEDLHPMQAAFIAHDGFQCGYCTCGQIVSAVAMLEEAKRGAPSQVTVDLAQAPVLSGAEIRERMSGNLCRCSAYVNIVAAIDEVARA